MALDPAYSKVTVNGAAVSSGTASGPIALALGVDTITVLVTANGGTTKTYQVTITRGSTDLSGLSIRGREPTTSWTEQKLSPTFNPDTVNYTDFTVLTSTNVTPTASAPVTSTITVNGKVVKSGAASDSVPLALGANKITVVVTSFNGAKKTYQITLTRIAAGSYHLSDLTLSAGPLSPTFNSDTIYYRE